MHEDTSLITIDANGNGLTHASGALAAREKERRDLIKRTAMAPQATDDEFRLFLFVAERLGLDPLARQIYAIHRKNGKDDHGHDRYQMTIQTGIDGYFAIASDTPGFAGIDDVIFDTEDAPHPNKATVTGYRMVDGQRVPYTASVRWNEYAQRKPVWRNSKPVVNADGQPVYEYTGKWVDMPYNQLGKCAVAKLLRMIAPKKLSGVYVDDEMDQADNPLPAAQIVESRKPGSAQAAPHSEPEHVTAAQWDALKARMRSDAKLTTVALAAAFMKAHIGRDLAGELPTQAEYDKLSAAVDRAAKQLRNVARTTARPEPEPEPAPDEMAEAQADYDATTAADFPSPDNDYDLSKLEIPAVRP